LRKDKEALSVDEIDILILQGDDRLAIQTNLSKLTQNDVNGFADLNTSRLDGLALTFHDVSMQLNMLPLGTGKRIIILENALDLLKKKGGKDWLEGVLDNFPPTTLLVFILEDEKKWKSGKTDWLRIKEGHWISKSIRAFSGKHKWKELPLPSIKEMPGWIIVKAKSMGGNFHPAAAQALANLIGNNLFQAKQEIEKAISYAGESKQVSAADVRLLCAVSKEEDIFSLVDAVGKRDGRKISNLLYELSMNIPLQYIFSMLVRQIRLLMLTKIVQNNRGDSKSVVQSCDIKSEWQAKKLITQARHFKMSDLEYIYKQLDRIDEESKTGRISLDVSIESLLASLTVKA